jgi:hypothetical protein
LILVESVRHVQDVVVRFGAGADDQLGALTGRREGRCAFNASAVLPGFENGFTYDLSLSPEASGKALDLLFICHTRLQGIISIRISSFLQDPTIPDIAHGL